MSDTGTSAERARRLLEMGHGEPAAPGHWWFSMDYEGGRGPMSPVIVDGRPDIGLARYSGGVWFAVSRNDGLWSGPVTSPEDVAALARDLIASEEAHEVTRRGLAVALERVSETYRDGRARVEDLHARASGDIAAVVVERDEARAEVEQLRVERDRLVRVLAVERGDESQAPEGWTAVPPDCWTGHCGTCSIQHELHEHWPTGRWRAFVDGRDIGAHDYGLGAMLAADAAREAT